MFDVLKAKLDALKAHVAVEEKKFLAGVKPMLHDVLATVEAAEVAAQVVTSVGVDKTSAGADVLNAGQAASNADNSADALNAQEAAGLQSIPIPAP